MVEYDVPDREGNGKDELIVLVTTITDYRQATAETLARAYHERWVRHEVAWSEWNSRKEDRLMPVT